MPDPKTTKEDAGSKGVELLYETPETGKLQVDPDTGKASRLREDAPGKAFEPSLVGPLPRYGYGGQRGLGGSVVAETHPATHQMTPEQLMQWANKTQADLARDNDDKSTAVDPAIIRSRFPGGDAPDWLQLYMSKQPFTDPYHQTPMTASERVMSNKY